MVVEDQRGALREVELRRELEGHRRRRDGDLGEAPEPAERGDTVAFCKARARGRFADGAGDLAAGHERELGLDLVGAAGLQHLGEGHPGRVDVDHHGAVGGEEVRRVRLGHLGDAHRASRPGQLDDLDGLHRRDGIGRNPSPSAPAAGAYLSPARN